MNSTPIVPERNCSRSSRNLRRHGFLALTVLIAAFTVLSGCHRDPEVAKQKYMESGKRYSGQGKWREAAIQFGNALKIDRNYPEAHFELAQTMMHLGDFRQAFAEFQHTVDLDQTNFPARIALANLLMAGGRVDDAQAQANAVMAARPNNPDLHSLLSAIALKRGQKDVAITEMRRAIELDPNRATFHDNLAFLLTVNSDNPSAVEQELKKAAALDPKSSGPKIMLMAFYAKNNRLPEAEQLGWSAAEADPKNVAVRQDLAKVILQMGDQSRAEQVLRQASRDLSNDPQGVRLLADYYTSSGQFDKAKAEFATIAAQHPKDDSLQKAYARALIQAGDVTTARSVVSSMMKKQGKDPQVIALNGIVLINQGKTADAVSALQVAVKDSPKDAFLQYWLGRAALANGDSSLAETSFLEAQKLNPSMLGVEDQLAEIASQLGDMTLLADVAEKTIAVAPRYAPAYVWRSYTDLKHNDVAKAESDLKTAIDVAPRNPIGYLSLGRLRFDQKRFAEGTTLLEQALQYNPDSVDALRVLVSYELAEKQPEKALARVNQQIALRPKNSGFYVLLAALQLQSKNMDQAAATAQKAMELNPADIDAVGLDTQIAVMRGQTANAIATWQQWVNAHQSDASAWARLGTLEEAAGNKGQAEVHYRKAIEIDPRQPLAANNLAYLMLVNGENSDVALSLAETARRSLPNSPSTADTLAWAYYYKGTYGFARDLLEDATKAQPGDATMQYHLGMVYSKLKDKSDAVTHLKKAISLDPDSPTAKDAQAALNSLG